MTEFDVVFVADSESDDSETMTFVRSGGSLSLPREVLNIANEQSSGKLRGLVGCSSGDSVCRKKQDEAEIVHFCHMSVIFFFCIRLYSALCT